MKPLIDADILRRFCKQCGIEKALDKFVKHKQCQNGYSYQCKKCRGRYLKDNRGPRGEAENKKNRERKYTLVEMFHRKCHDCGGQFPDYVYDFHHLDPNKKDMKISSFRRIDKLLLKELEKCIMLCSNCHRVRHWDISDKTEGKRGTG